VRDTTVAARYAHALLLVTERRGETVPALDDLRAMTQLIAPSTPAGKLFATPQVMLSDKLKALHAVLDGKALRSVILFIDLLLKKKRLRELDTIFAEFEALVEKQQGIQRAQVVSAVPLLPRELEQIQRDLEQSTGSHIRMTTTVDPRVLGGVHVRLGDRVIDRTVKTLLERIEQQLLETPV
jgi:F-type H+-transporting ATPase subunit delta